MIAKRVPSAKRRAALPATLIASNNAPAETREQAEKAVMKIAVLIGRQIAREEFARQVAEDPDQHSPS